MATQDTFAGDFAGDLVGDRASSATAYDTKHNRALKNLIAKMKGCQIFDRPQMIYELLLGLNLRVHACGQQYLFSMRPFN